MKKVLSLVIASILFFASVPVNAAEPDVSGDFTDDVFRGYVYSLVGKTEPEPIYRSELWGIYIVSLPDGVKSLDGIENFYSTTVFDLGSNSFETVDLSKLNNIGILKCDVTETREIDLRGNYSDHITLLTEGENPTCRVLLPDPSCGRAMICLSSEASSLIGNFKKATAEKRRFSDVSDKAWYSGCVSWASERGYMLGLGTLYTKDSVFDPDREITRAEFIEVLYRVAGRPKVGDLLPFKDIKGKYLYLNAIKWGYEKGIIDGVGNGRFSPNGILTREQAAVILKRYAETREFDVSARAGAASFPDSAAVSAWAGDSVSWALADGIILGLGVGDKVLISPNTSLTRAQACAVVMRVCKKI